MKQEKDNQDYIIELTRGASIIVRQTVSFQLKAKNEEDLERQIATLIKGDCIYDDYWQTHLTDMEYQTTEHKDHGYILVPPFQEGESWKSKHYINRNRFKDLRPYQEMVDMEEFTELLTDEK